MFQLRTEFEVYLAVKNGRVVSRLLQRFQKVVKLCSDFGLLGLEILLHLYLNRIHS